MKKVVLGMIVGLLSGGVGVWLFLRPKAGQPEARHDEEKKEEPIVQRGPDGDTFLKLDEKVRNRADLKVALLQAAALKPEVRAFGRVLDPAPIAASLSEIAATQAQLEASMKETRRLKTLFAQDQNVSARAVEIAEGALTRDRIAVEAAQFRLLTSWGKAIAGRPDLDRFVRSLIVQEIALVRVDVPATERVEGAPIGARLALLSAPGAPIDADFLDAALSSDPQTLGRGFILLVKGRALAANAAVTAWLSLPGEPEKGVIIPREAIVRHNGEGFVYLQTGEDTFERKRVELHHPLTAGWFTDGFKAGSKVVINGAQQLLSEELKGEGE